MMTDNSTPRAFFRFFWWLVKTILGLIPGLIKFIAGLFKSKKQMPPERM